MARFYLITFCAHELLVEEAFMLVRLVLPPHLGTFVGAHHHIGRSI